MSQILPYETRSTVPFVLMTDTNPERRRGYVQHISTRHALPERRVCRVIGQPRSTQRYRRVEADDEAALTAAIVRLASAYGRYGYRRITALLRGEGWYVNHKRVERIWRREGLKVPAKQPKRGRLWLNDGSCHPSASELAAPCLGL